MNCYNAAPYNTFAAGLQSNHAYASSGPGRRALFPALQYYWGLARVVFGCRSDIRNGVLDAPSRAKWSHLSLRSVEKAGGTVEIAGLEHFAAVGGPCVIVSNHMSLLETFLLPCLVIPFSPMCIVLKEELLAYPVFGKVMQAIPHVAVTRDNPRADFRIVLERGVEMIRQGTSVLIFPQSTRNLVFVPGEFNSLGAKLAAKAGVPIVPVALKTDFHGISKIGKDFGPIRPDRPVRVAFGPAVSPASEGRQAHQKVVDFIAGKLTEWNMPVQAAVPAAPASS